MSMCQENPLRMGVVDEDNRRRALLIARNKRFHIAMISAGYIPTDPLPELQPENIPEPLPEPNPQPETFFIQVQYISKVVAWHCGMNKDSINAKKRTRGIVFARQMAMHLARTLTKHSYPEISRRFGLSDHSTSLHAHRKITKLRASDPEFDAEVTMLEDVCKQEGSSICTIQKSRITQNALCASKNRRKRSGRILSI